MCDIAKEMGLTIQMKDINNSHFLGPVNQSSNAGRQVIANFVRYTDKVSFLSARKKLRDSKTYKSVFVNEDLTRARYSLLRSLQILRRDNKIHSAWSYGGKIFYKPRETDRPILVKDVMSFDPSQV